jgi:hypothetical protein
MNKTAWIILAALFLTSCGPSPEMKAINDAAEALGGKDRIQQIKTLTIEGDGVAPNLGQNSTPDNELPIWRVTGYRRTMELSSGRMRMKQVREALFPFAGAPFQRFDLGVDGDIAYNVSEIGRAVRAPESEVTNRRIEMLHHPITLLHAALDPAARAGNLRSMNDYDAIDVTTANGDAFTLEIDRATKMPLRITSMSYNPNLGDVAIETSLSDYETVSGVKVPKRLTTKIDEYPQFDLRVTKNEVDGDTGDLAAPEQVRSMKIPAAAAIAITAEEVGKGIWWLAGPGNYRSTLFAFADHLVLFEAPVNEEWTKAVIDKAKSLRPAMPLTHVIMSHHHFDHSGGLRAAVAEGLTIIAHSGNVKLFKELVARKHSIVQDALAKNPKPLKIEPVEDELILKDESMEVRLYHVKNNAREGTNLFAYVPRDRILVQADLYDSSWLWHPWGDNLAFNVGLRKLQVDKSVPVHGRIQTYPEVLKTIAARKPPANSGN